eukprot:114119_1
MTALLKLQPNKMLHRLTAQSTCHLQRHTFSGLSKQMSKGNIVVQKFGGTSLGTSEKMQKVINIIQQFKKQSDVIVVVSALSSENKVEGTTSRLLLAAHSAVEKKEFDTYLSQIEDTHLDIMYTLLKSRKAREQIRSIITNELNEIASFCSSLSVIRELSPRSHDKIIGCGERMAAALTSAILNDSGYDSNYINLSNIFDNLDTNKSNYHTLIKNEIKNIIDEELNAGAIPVITGFFGHVKGGIIDSIGRGYTDLTSALCAGAMHAKTLQVWKESDGIFTGNPTKIEDAHLLSFVTAEEASELTSFGNEVLNPFTMRCAINDNIPIQILNTFEPNGSGTVINKEDTMSENEAQSPHGIIAVCSKTGINVINLSINDHHKSLGEVFDLFNKHNVRIDLISTSVTNLSVAIHESVSMLAIKELIHDLEQVHGLNGNINLNTNRSIVSCVGSGMHHQIGIAAKIFGCLSAQNVNIEMISQGSSEISISVVIHADQMDQAIKAIHKDYIADTAKRDNGNGTQQNEQLAL